MKLRKLFGILIVLLLSVLLLIANAYLAFWNRPTQLFHLNPDEITMVHPFSPGVIGLNITDRELIEYLTDTLNSTTYHLKIYDPGHRFDGYDLLGTLTFHFADGRKLTVCPSLYTQSLVFYSETTPLPGAYSYWEAYPPGFDYEMIRSIVFHGTLPNGEVLQ